jgi:hypothetical protein
LGTGIRSCLRNSGLWIRAAMSGKSQATSTQLIWHTDTAPYRGVRWSTRWFCQFVEEETARIRLSGAGGQLRREAQD